MGDDLELAGRASTAGDHSQIAACVAPVDRCSGGAQADPAVGDQGAQTLAPQAEDGQQVVDAVGARGAVAEEQLDLVGARHTQTIELVDIGGELHEGRDAGPPREFRVLHDPRPRAVGTRFGLAHQEVGEADELVGGERRLIDDLGRRVGESAIGEVHGLGEGLGVGGASRGDLAHRRAEARAVRVEHAHLVGGAQTGGAFEGGVFGVVHGGDAAQLGVDGAQPRELALGRGLQVAGAPDDSRVVLDVPHTPTLTATPDIARCASTGCVRAIRPPRCRRAPARLGG
ncbi:hypothetical protein QE414_003083 [Microbacterium sp. SORGH_AS 344]|nr:hypothetical protein [Microbacterium sp. SORGH_AS_0344]